MPRDRPLVAAARLELRTTGVSHVRVLTLGRPEHTMTAAGNLNAPFHGRCLAFRDRVLGGTRGGTQRGRSSELSVLHFRWTALRLGGWVAGRAGLRRVRSACSCRQSCLVCGGPNGSTVLEPDVQPLSRGLTRPGCISCDCQAVPAPCSSAAPQLRPSPRFEETCRLGTAAALRCGPAGIAARHTNEPANARPTRAH